MMKLAKAYKMLKTCFIKTGAVIPVREEFTAGEVYATKDIPVKRLKVWLEEGFCIPAVESAKVTAVKTPEEKAEAAEKTATAKAEKVAATAEKKAAAEAEKADKKKLEKEKTQAKKDQAEAKKEAEAKAKADKAAEKKANAEKVAAEKVEAEAKAEAEKVANWFVLWDHIPVEDYPQYVELAEASGYELDDAPGVEDPAVWLAYFVPFFGENGPPALAEAE